MHTAPIDRLAPLRHHHRLALPLLAPSFSRTRVDADVTICSSSGWAHGVDATGRKLVYCHAPARWLYQREAYTAQSSAPTRAVMAGLHRPLQRWDQRAARSADLYLANSTRTQAMIRDAYGFDAEILHPPHRIDPDGPRTPVAGIEPGYFLCVSRLLPYKNVDLAIAAFAELPDERLVVVGRGPDQARLRAMAGPNVTFLPEVDDTALRWLVRRTPRPSSPSPSRTSASPRSKRRPSAPRPSSAPSGATSTPSSTASTASTSPSPPLPRSARPSPACAASTSTTPPCATTPSPSRRPSSSSGSGPT